MPIDIHGNILDALESYSSDAVVAFLAVAYFDNTSQAVASAFGVRLDVVQDWIRQIRTDVRRAYRREGGRISHDGSTVGGMGQEDPSYLVSAAEQFIDNDE